MLELLVEHQAGMPLLRKPLSGNTNDSKECGRVVTEHVQQLRTAHRLTSLVADSALYNADNLRKLAQSGVQWITRVPATLNEAQAVLAHVTPDTMPPFTDGYRSQEVSSTYGGITQRWLVVYAEARQKRGRRTVDQQVQTQSAAEQQAFKQLCRTAFACLPDAQQALERFQQGLQATRLAGETMHAVARYGKRGRPLSGTSPQQGE